MNNGCGDGRTFYDTLGVSRSANNETIRKAYLRLSFEHHPDKNPKEPDLAKARFVEIGQAYQTLSDPTLRTRYDYGLFFGSEARASCGGRPSPTSFPTTNSSYESHIVFFDLFVASLSETELEQIATGAGVVGLVVGCLSTVRMARNAVGKTCLATLGGLLVAVISYGAAETSVRFLRRQSAERTRYHQARRTATKEGEVADPEPQYSWRGRFLKMIDGMKASFRKQVD